MSSRMSSLYFGSISFMKVMYYPSYVFFNSICFQASKTQTVVNISVESFSESAVDVARVVMVEISVEICFMLLLVFNNLFQILINQC